METIKTLEKTQLLNTLEGMSGSKAVDEYARGWDEAIKFCIQLINKLPEIEVANNSIFPATSTDSSSNPKAPNKNPLKDHHQANEETIKDTNKNHSCKGECCNCDDEDFDLYLDGFLELLTRLGSVELGDMFDEETTKRPSEETTKIPNVEVTKRPNMKATKTPDMETTKIPKQDPQENKCNSPGCLYHGSGVCSGDIRGCFLEDLLVAAILDSDTD